MSLRRCKADKKTSPGDVFVFGASFTFANIFRVCEVADRASFHFTLIKLFAVFHLCIGNKLFDALFILFLADQEDITGFGHDAIIDALYDGKTFRIVEGRCFRTLSLRFSGAHCFVRLSSPGQTAIPMFRGQPNQSRHRAYIRCLLFP